MRCVALVLSAAILAQATPAVTGRVVDATGLPLPGAVIAVKNGAAVGVTNDDGSFTLSTVAPGTTLIVDLPGFVSREIRLDSRPAATPLTITLTVAGISQAVTVSGQAPTFPAPTHVLTPLDVVRTPGTQADLMQALGTLPGVARVDDGTGLFVRGGDVSETVVLLDGVVVNHPYRYETPTGGFRGAIDPFLTQGVSFTTGAFPAQYANALSGIVELVPLDRPREPHMTLTAGLAGVSASIARPFGDRAGIRAGANRSTPSVLFAVNPSPGEFDRLPGGWDVSGSAHVESPRAGSLRAFALAQSDHVGVELEKDSFVGFLHSGTRHGLVALRWERGVGSWRTSTAGGYDLYRKSTDVGVLALDEDEGHASVRTEALTVAKGWTMRFGADADRGVTRVDGRVPSQGGDFGGFGGVAAFTVDRSDWRAGASASLSRRMGPFAPEVGARIDRFDDADTWAVDPRVAIRWQISKARALRFAWGRYHQAPPPGYFDRQRGAARLRPMEATHYVAGYERGEPGGAVVFRAEAYWKRYQSLPLEDTLTGFASTGFGTARGIDLFARRIWPRLDLRLSGSALHARRRWTAPEQRERYPLPDGTWIPDFAIPYSWVAVANVPLVRGLAVAGTWKVAAGRPFTPVTGTVPTPNGMTPVWGAINSERLPRYERLDLAASILTPLGDRTTAVFFASVDNIFDRHNFFEYAYSADYSIRRPVRSAAPRSFYVGCSISR